MSAMKDLTGQTFGYFVVIEATDKQNAKQQKFWKCKCILCGRFYEIRGDRLRRSESTKCSNCRNGAGRASHELL